VPAVLTLVPLSVMTAGVPAVIVERAIRQELLAAVPVLAVQGTPPVPLVTVAPVAVGVPMVSLVPLGTLPPPLVRRVTVTVSVAADGMSTKAGDVPIVVLGAALEGWTTPVVALVPAVTV
jgi:hypothetical protein